MTYFGKSIRNVLVGVLAFGAMATASLAQDKPSIISFNGPASGA